jgi:hypothetical protein
VLREGLFFVCGYADTQKMLGEHRLTREVKLVLQPGISDTIVTGFFPKQKHGISVYVRRSKVPVRKR